ncbi:MAG: hypothetical protein FJ290_16260 [Planctomycetes bacterium]|nr:hypothetical protein [Planctomycetota bacterium]
MRVKAIALLSGGLDSSLAIRLMLDQGIEVEALHFVSIFNATAPEKPSLLRPLRVARQLGVPLVPMRFTAEQLALLRDPAHGFGSQMNPCIDCHMAMLRLAAERMRETGAQFLVTGEVLGQRPMSQRSFVLHQIAKDTGLGGLILRPLSAKLLPPTIPEEKGWVDRERLLDIYGRSRKRQLELARHYALTEHGSPAGGCLLTDPGFAARLRDYFGHLAGAEPDLNDLHLLKYGRHFRLDAATRVIIGRVHRENVTVYTFSRPADLLLTTRDAPGPTALLRCATVGLSDRAAEAESARLGKPAVALLRGSESDEHIRTAAALTARYSKLRAQPLVAISVTPGRSHPGPASRVIEVAPSEDAAADERRIGA